VLVKIFFWGGGGTEVPSLQWALLCKVHLSCLQVSDTEYTFYMANYESPYKCGACVKQLRPVSDENTPIRSLRFVSIVSPDRELILPPLKDNILLIVQLETVRLYGVCTENMI
jgi:hypothetical protein